MESWFCYHINVCMGFLKKSSGPKPGGCHRKAESTARCVQRAELWFTAWEMCQGNWKAQKPLSLSLLFLSSCPDATRSLLCKQTPLALQSGGQNRNANMWCHRISVDLLSCPWKTYSYHFLFVHRLGVLWNNIEWLLGAKLACSHS